MVCDKESMGQRDILGYTLNFTDPEDGEELS
jgi:hypothetical protein